MEHFLSLRKTVFAFSSLKRVGLSFLLLASFSAHGQTYQFAARGGGTGKEEFLDFKIDDAENSYVLLKYDGNVTFGDDSYSNPSLNTLIVKYDKDGNQLMTKDIVAEAPGLVFGAIGVSADGVVVAAAPTEPGMLDGQEVYGGTFIGKLGGDGNFEWVLQPIDSIDGTRQFLEFRVTAIEVAENEIYVAATADGKITINGFTDPGYASDNETSALLIKLDLDGNVLWIKNIPTPEVANHPTIDGGMDHLLISKDGEHIYAAGKVGDGSYNPYEVAFLAKFKTDGTFLWLKKTSSTGSDSFGVAEASNGDLITGFGVGGSQIIDFGDGASLEGSETGWLGALARFDKDGNVKMLAYVADALFSDKSSISSTTSLRLYHLTVNQADQAILMGEIAGAHSFKNGIETASTPGLVGASPDVAIIVCDLDFNPLNFYSNTGGNNEAAHKGASKGNKLYFAGIYESFTHPALGAFKPQFGEFTFESAGDQDVFVVSLTVPIPQPPPQIRLDILKQENSFTLSWPSIVSDAALEFAPELDSESWSILDLTPILVGEQWEVVVPIVDDAGFYRLRYQD